MEPTTMLIVGIIIGALIATIGYIMVTAYNRTEEKDGCDDYMLRFDEDDIC